MSVEFQLIRITIGCVEIIYKSYISHVYLILYLNLTAFKI